MTTFNPRDWPAPAGLARSASGPPQPAGDQPGSARALLHGSGILPVLCGPRASGPLMPFAFAGLLFPGRDRLA